MPLNCGAGEDELSLLWTARRPKQSILKNWSWIFIGRTDVEAEAPILWPPDAKRQLIGKDPNAKKDWRQEEKGMTEDEMAGWHHWPNGHEFEQTPGDSEGKGSLACWNPWGCRVRHNRVTEQHHLQPGGQKDTSARMSLNNLLSNFPASLSPPYSPK